MTSYTEISGCRIDSGSHLISVLNLGNQSLTGVFPESSTVPITSGPLELVWAPQSGLLQLRHSYPLDEMYGENYGYRSGLNAAMIRHLHAKIQLLQRRIELKDGDVVLDIGSNDSTTLRAYTQSGLIRVGIDPTGEKFSSYYPDDVILISDFFSSKVYFKNLKKKAKIITSIAMLYDLETPVDFAQQVAEVLDTDGIWHCEQSYMPSMLRLNAYDTVCHEHLEYYSLQTLKKIFDRADLRIVDVVMNGVNGGSFAVTVTHKSNKTIRSNTPVIEWLLEQETRMGLDTPKPYRDFEERVFRHRDELRKLIHMLNAEGKTIVGYGASTKGNVLLQFCQFTEKHICAIADVNPDKYGKVTPGTHIPIISEEEAKRLKPDYLLVLPWHFKAGFLEREQEFLAGGGHMIFPLPEIEIV